MFRMAIFSMTILLLTGLVYAQCGPNPFTSPSISQPLSSPNVNMQQQQAQQRAIDQMNARYEYGRDMQQLQHNFRLQQMQNQGNPQAMQQAAQQFQQSVQQLQQRFQQRMQSLNQMR